MQYVALISVLSEVVELPESVPPIRRDPDDDWVIACAVVREADFIVSGDRDLLALERVGQIPVLSAAQLLATLEARGGRTPG
jgi:predicted nucleic acid-binding protein